MVAITIDAALDASAKSLVAYAERLARRRAAGCPTLPLPIDAGAGARAPTLAVRFQDASASAHEEAARRHAEATGTKGLTKLLAAQPAPLLSRPGFEQIAITVKGGSIHRRHVSVHGKEHSARRTSDLCALVARAIAVGRLGLVHPGYESDDEAGVFSWKVEWTVETPERRAEALIVHASTPERALRLALWTPVIRSLVRNEGPLRVLSVTRRIDATHAAQRGLGVAVDPFARALAGDRDAAATRKPATARGTR